MSTQGPLDLQRARHELEVLKQRERELEQRLGLGEENETTDTKTHKNIVFIDLHKNQTHSPPQTKSEGTVNGGTLSPFFAEDETENNLTSSPIPVIIEEQVDDTTDITSNESVTLNLQEDIEYDTDQYDGDSLSEDSQTPGEVEPEIHFCSECLEKFQHNEPLENLNGEISSDDDQKTTIDLRQKIREDIEENRKREIELQFERGSIENLADYVKDNESDSDISEVAVHEDVRAKILREIEAEKMRDLEIQARYKQEGFEIDEDHDNFQKTQIDLKSRDPKIMLEKELEELALREKELHMDDPNYGSDDFDENSVREDIDTRGKIKRELEEQKEREAEMEKLRRSLSHLNLASNDNESNTMGEIDDDEDESISEKITAIDTRQKILEEIEEQKKREEEIKKQSGKIESRLDEKADVSDNEVDYVECQKMDMRKVIENEMNENLERENEMKTNKEAVVEEEITVIYNPQSSLLADKPPNDVQLDFPLNKKFGSRDDLLAHMGSAERSNELEKYETSTEDKIKEKRSFQAAVSKLQIPKIFMQETAKNKFSSDLFKKKTPRQQSTQNIIEQVIITKDVAEVQNSINENQAKNPEKNTEQETKMKNVANEKNKSKRKKKTTSENHSSNSSRHRDKNKSAKENHLEAKTNKRVSTNPFSPRQNNNPFAQDVTDGEKMNGYANGETTISKDKIKEFAMLPSDEATNLSKAKALFSNNRNPFKIAMLAEHWEKKSNEQNELNKSFRNRENNEKEHRRSKQESLEFLWKSKKPVVTEEENPDKNDLELLTYMKEIRREYKEQNGGLSTNRPQQPTSQQTKDVHEQVRGKPEPLQTAITLEKTIRKWEKRIAKHSSKSDGGKKPIPTDKINFI